LASLSSLVPALPAIIRLGWEGLSGTNTLAYLKIRKLWTKKFIKLVPVEDVIKTIFFPSSLMRQNKLDSLSIAGFSG
jgi:hypothetical protein